MEYRKVAEEIFLKGVESVTPQNLINRYVKIKKNILIVQNLKIDLTKVANIYVIGAGKASAMMASAIESILGDRITDGQIITKYNHSVPLKYINITEAGHPIPDENGLKGTNALLEIAHKATKDDVVICLISGGGSALMVDVPARCSLSDLKILNDILLKCGADIKEMNCIRKHLSNVKGGKLAKMISPALLITLIISDVVGNQLDVIASGPTTPDSTTFADSLQILKKYNIQEQVPTSIFHHLCEGLSGINPETWKANEKLKGLYFNLIIGNNKLALNESAKVAESFGYITFIITNVLEGDVSVVLKIMSDEIRKHVDNKQKICLLFGGEPTVKVKGNGLGGRNQHIALLATRLLTEYPHLTLLSGATDGSDGPTDAAGAVIDYMTLVNALVLNLDVNRYIDDFNSYYFFKTEGGLITTGPTGTNVMDMIVVLLN